MIRIAASKVMWVGRATVFLVGLAVILALVFGVATTAIGATGGNFLLGKANVAERVSTLVKSGPGPALSLEVGEGQAPMKVNSSARVNDLNADLLDGKSAKELEGQAGPQGLQGEQGIQGPQGERGPEGPVNPNAELLDNKDATDFLGASAKAADSDKLDGRDASSFASGAGGVADNANSLDGLDSSQFARADLFGGAVGSRAGGSQGLECTLGEVGLFAGNVLPENWLPAHGQLLSKNANLAFFSVLGTTYGGNGETTFALPDLRGSEPNGAGQAAPYYAICVSGVYPA